ncbi:MAG TPA: DUF1707 domain-containing protein [Solirubrobacteraceae bacterium]|nr:DUF1707 domain-containing protein [Solirubrobacteraceae bacterium]
MTTQAPARLASEEVIISAPMSYVGSAQRIGRLRRRVDSGWELTAVTTLVVVLTVLAWLLVTVWYLSWGLLLVPYRLIRRGQRKRKVEALRHRELLGALNGTIAAVPRTVVPPPPPTELVADVDRERTVDELRQHLMSGRLTTSEFETRLALAHAARTQGDLASARADLPPAQG